MNFFLDKSNQDMDSLIHNTNQIIKTSWRLNVSFAISMMIIFFGLTMSSPAQNPTWLWAASAGGTGWDYAGINNGNTIATDANGNSFITGSFNGTAAFGLYTVTATVSPDIFVAKYDINGNCLWVRNAGGDDPDIYGDQGVGIDVDALGNCYVTGTFHGSDGSNAAFSPTISLTGTGAREIFTAKYDANGVVLWAKKPINDPRWNMVNNYAKGIATDASGYSFITGYLGGGIYSFDAYSVLGTGAYVVKYDPAGNAMWATKIGIYGAADGMCIDIDLQGNSFVSGYLQGTENFSTGTLTSIGDRDVYIARVTASGILDWVKHYGGTNAHSYGFGICTDLQGNVIVTGAFSNKLTFGSNVLSGSHPLNGEAFIAKFNNNGIVQWAKQSHAAGTSSITGSYSIKAKGNGDCIIAGHYMGEVTFGTQSLPNNYGQTYLSKFDASGTCLWALATGPTNGGDPYPWGISLDGNDGIYIAGNFQGLTDFGSLTINAVRGYDIFVAKLQDIVNVPPTITCPNNIVVSNSPGQCAALVNFTVTTTGEPAPAVTFSHVSGSSFPVGSTTVTCTATNSAGSASCSFDVTVIDNELPTIVCPSNITANPTSLSGAVVNYTAPVGQDNCGGAVTAMTSGLASGSNFPIGVTNITYTVTDASGNSVSCNFSVTVRNPGCANNKVNVCHNGHTICISVNALQTHLDHGDFLGDCLWYITPKISAFDIPLHYENQLSQNYPNPFNPTTIINYTLIVDAVVVLDVVDIMGQKVAELVNGFKKAGYFNVMFDAKELPDGIYFYRLVAGQQTLCRKMSVLK
ncbi:MAG: hypothetical protein HW421_670 [Ignavibacteria bacterium]|nr:hypothetical protein [Ignavibacteria bacterium]